MLVFISPRLLHCVLLLLNSDLCDGTVIFITIGHYHLRRKHSAGAFKPASVACRNKNLESHGHSIVECEGFFFVALHILCILLHTAYKTKSPVPWADTCLGTPTALRRGDVSSLHWNSVGGEVPSLAFRKVSKKLPFTYKYDLLPCPPVSLVLFSQFELITIFMTSYLINVATLRHFPNILKT